MTTTLPNQVDADVELALPSAATRAIAPTRALVFGDRRIPLDGSDRPLFHIAKRFLDLVASAVALVALSPLIAVLATAIAVSSRGPILYRQQRWGSRRRVAPDGVVEWEARLFTCIKFRTMVWQADESPHVRHVEAFVRGQLPSADNDGFKLRRDPRVTRVGRALRTTSLDELPQILNVLAGQMSIVGPRPVPPYEVATYPADRCLARLGALPGITGPWQVDGRSSVPFEAMMKLDLEYVAHPSLRRDLSLILRTVPCILRRRGAQ